MGRSQCGGLVGRPWGGQGAGARGGVGESTPALSMQLATSGCCRSIYDTGAPRDACWRRGRPEQPRARNATQAM